MSSLQFRDLREKVRHVKNTAALFRLARLAPLQAAAPPRLTSRSVLTVLQDVFGVYKDNCLYPLYWKSHP